jgi:hypothetical protein
MGQPGSLGAGQPLEWRVSLVCALDVNRIGVGAGLITVRRTSELTSVDAIHTYEYAVYSGESAVRVGLVDHKYSDGALHLLALVMADAQPHLPRRGPR